MDTIVGVVIIEDDPLVLELHRQYIVRIKNFSLLGCARDGTEGLRLISKKQPHLAIIDIYMPGMSGLDLLKHIRKQGWNTDVILVTAAHDVESVQQGIQYGAADYIIKPFTFGRLKKALEHYRQYFNKLRCSDTSVSQTDIDRLKTNNCLTDKKSALPKGLQQTTLNHVMGLLRDTSGYFTARDVATALGISRVTAKRYLNFLHENGCLQETLCYGPVGRPLQRFLVNKGMMN